MRQGAPAAQSVLLGKYRIERMLGEGGMGYVAMAHHLQLDEPVAIKFLVPDLLDKPEVVQRFLREAQAAVKLKSEHVARVIDVGTLESGAPYMVMEYLDGEDLGAMLETYGAIEPRPAVDLILQACDALAEAHALGIVHRDIKPSNLFITRRRDGSPLVKVLDFGISKAPIDAGITRTQAVMGTPAYMSPEQMRSAKAVDSRADIWSLGVVLYEALSGHRPFEGEAYSELCLKVAMEPAAPLLVPMPAGLDRVVSGCLEKDPAKRIQTIADLASALVPYAADPAHAQRIADRCARTQGRGPLPRAATPTHTTPTPTSLTGAASEVVSTAPPSRRRGALFAAMAVFFVIGGGIAALLATRGGHEDAPGAREVSATSAADASVAAAVVQAVTPDAGAPIDAGAVAETAPLDAALHRKPPRKKKPKKPAGGDEGSDVDLFGSRE